MGSHSLANNAPTVPAIPIPHAAKAKRAQPLPTVTTVQDGPAAQLVAKHARAGSEGARRRGQRMNTSPRLEPVAHQNSLL